MRFLRVFLKPLVLFICFFIILMICLVVALERNTEAKQAKIAYYHTTKEISLVGEIDKKYYFSDYINKKKVNSAIVVIQDEGYAIQASIDILATVGSLYIIDTFSSSSDKEQVYCNSDSTERRCFNGRYLGKVR